MPDFGANAPIGSGPISGDERIDQGPGTQPLCYPRITNALQQVSTQFPSTITCEGVVHEFDHVIEDICGRVRVHQNRHAVLTINQCEDREPCEASAVAIYVPPCIPTPENNWCDDELEPGDCISCGMFCAGSVADFTVIDFGPGAPGFPPPPLNPPECGECSTPANEAFEDTFRGFAISGISIIPGCQWLAEGNIQLDPPCIWQPSHIIPETTSFLTWRFHLILQITYCHREISRISASILANISVNWTSDQVPCQTIGGHRVKGGFEALPEISARFGSPAGACAFAKAYVSRTYQLSFGGANAQHTRLDFKVDLR